MNAGAPLIAVLSFLQLGFELLFIKLGQYQFATLSIGFVSLALLGSALAAPLTRLRPRRQDLARSCIRLLPVAAFLSGVILFSQRHQYTTEGAAWLSTLICGLPALLTLMLAAVPVYASIEEAPGQAGRLYAASLLGAAGGAAFVFPAMEFAGDTGAYAALLGLSTAAAATLAPRLNRVGVAALGAAAAALALICLPRLDRAAHAGAMFTESDSVTRIDVLRGSGRALQFRTAGINAGSSAFDSRVRGSESHPMRDALALLPFSFSPRKVLILGAGGGRQVVDAIRAGATEVVAVEINKMIPRYMDAHMAPANNPYRDPATRLVVGEGRETAARLAWGGESFDLVYVPIATRFGSSGYLFTHTYLMTQDALVQYLAMTSRHGAAAVFFKDDARIRQKVLKSMADALLALGVSRPEEHLLCFANGFNFLVVGSRESSFRPRFLAALKAEQRRALLDVGEELRRGEELLPLRDDNPYLFNDAEQRRPGWHKIFEWNLRLTAWIYLLAAGLLGAFWIAGTAAGAPDFSTRAGFLSAFAAMGMAYAIFQMALLQRLGFLLGHPTAATAVGLPAALLFTAAGSYALAGEGRSGGRPAVTGILVAACLALAFLSPADLILPGWSLAARGAGAALAAFPFLILGAYFPATVRLAQAHDSRTLLWGWLLNGVGAVAGFLLFLVASMRFGFSSLFLLVGAIYAVLSAWQGATGRWRRLAAGAMTAAVLGALLWGAWAAAG
jgi:spermidine synthase